MNEKKRELLITQLNIFKQLKIYSDEQDRYGVILDDHIVIPAQYLYAEIFLRANKYYPFNMKPIIWVVNHDHKEAYIGPNLKISRFNNFTSINKHSGTTFRGCVNDMFNSKLYQDIPIDRVDLENVMKLSFKNKENDRPII